MRCSRRDIAHVLTLWLNRNLPERFVASYMVEPYTLLGRRSDTLVQIEYRQPGHRSGLAISWVAMWEDELQVCIVKYNGYAEKVDWSDFGSESYEYANPKLFELVRAKLLTIMQLPWVGPQPNPSWPSTRRRHIETETR